MKSVYTKLLIAMAAFLFIVSSLHSQTNYFPSSGNAGIATNATPTLGALQIGLTGNTNQYKTVIPGVYNFERAIFGQYANGASGIELINHTSTSNSYGVRLLANSDQIAGLQFQYAPTASAQSSLTYSTGMFMNTTNGYIGIGTTNPGNNRLNVDP